METALAVTQAKYWHLRKLGLFAGLPDAELRQLVQLADLRLFKQGEVVYRPGDMADALYVIRTGTVKLTRPVGQDKEMILEFAGPGDPFGEGAIVGDGLRTDGAAIAEDAFLCIIERDRFLEHLSRNPALALELLRVFARRRAAAEDRASQLLALDVRTRLARALVDLADRHGERERRGIRIGIRLTQGELGQLVGSTRETTSMAFNGFRRHGWVASRDRTVWVVDREALATL